MIFDAGSLLGHWPHYTDEQMEAWKGWVACSRDPCQLLSELELEFSPSVCGSSSFHDAQADLDFWVICLLILLGLVVPGKGGCCTRKM